MVSRSISWLMALCLTVMTAGCAILDSGAERVADDSSGDSTTHQSVVIQPVFVLDGMDELPDGFSLDELHLGVGAIFLDRIEADDGVAFANRNPFQLHFIIRDGQLRATAPTMTLPQGGIFQVSVQLEPQPRLADVEDVSGVTSLGTPGDDASLVARGRIAKAHYPPLTEDEKNEPAPLPWKPIELEDMTQLRREVTVVPFSYASNRMVRFVLEDVELVGGSENQLVMRLAVNDWVREIVRPALNDALSDVDDEDPNTERQQDLDLELRERLDEDGAGMDRLIGGMDVEVREQPL
jgi:hypothetical protein